MFTNIFWVYRFSNHQINELFIRYKKMSIDDIDFLFRCLSVSLLLQQLSREPHNNNKESQRENHF